MTGSGSGPLNPSIQFYLSITNIDLLHAYLGNNTLFVDVTLPAR